MYNVKENSTQLDTFAECDEKTKLVALRTKLAEKLGERANQPFLYLTSHSRRFETWGLRIPMNRTDIKKGIQRIFRGTSLMDKPNEFIPNSYHTR
jgi:hypothetical protein